ncbi:MAG: TetR family transcriptional regulator [Solirubrobacteraceae bacterium]
MDSSFTDGVVTLSEGVGRERMVDIQRARILAAMVEVSAERGAGNVTVAHIVERAGVSRRTFYELFGDCEDCFLAAFDEGVARASRHVLDVYDPDARWEVRVRVALTALLDFLDVERGVGQLLVVGSLGAGANALERRRRVLAQMIAVVEEGRRETKGRAGQVELPSLTAEGLVGGVLSVLHARLLELEDESLLELAGPLMSMIVLPYLGAPAARRELKRPVAVQERKRKPVSVDPLRDVGMRLTYRTVRVLMAVAAHPGSSNRELGLASGIGDQGQISKLLTRLARLGLIANTDIGQARGAPNAWVLTPKGIQIEQTMG